MKILDLCQGTASLLKFYQTWIKHTTGKNKPSLVSAPIFRVTDQSTCTILKIVILIRICMVNGQGMPVQLICHTKPDNNHNFHIYGALRHFGVWVWQFVHFLILVSSVWPSFIGAVLSMIKAYNVPRVPAGILDSHTVIVMSGQIFLFHHKVMVHV